MSDGHCVYQGDAKKSAQYFRGLGFNFPAFSNPADKFMKILAINYPPNEKDTRKVKYFCDKYDVL